MDGRVEPYPLLAGRKFSSGKLLRDRDGGLWIGTHGQSLLHVHQGRTDVFTQSDGLSGEWVTNLFEDREGDIWVATLMASTAFVNSPSLRFQPSKVCRMPS